MLYERQQQQARLIMAIHNRRRIYYEDDGRDGIYHRPSAKPKVISQKWLDITWDFTEPSPVGRLSGFEVVILNGTDPDDPSIYLRAPEAVAADVRRYTTSVAMSTSLNNARAAVRAIYGAVKSAWTVQGIGQVISSDVSELALLEDLTETQQDVAEALNEANIALLQLGDISSDSKLTGVEKKAVVSRYSSLTKERNILKAQADSFGITSEKADYENALDALTSYLGGLSPAWNSINTTTTISRTIWNSNWEDVYQKKQILLRAVASVNQQGTLEAKQAAANAHNEAVAARTKATEARADLDDIAADNKLHPNEKSHVIPKYSELMAERSGIEARATEYGITTEKTNYSNAIVALNNYLSGTTWGSTSVVTSIVRSTWNAKWGAVYDTRQAVLDKIDQLAGAQVRSARYAFLEDFSSSDYPKYWKNWSPGTQTFYQSGYLKVGGGAARLTNGVTMFHEGKIPFDANKLYRIETRVYVYSGSDTTRTMYIGLAGYDAAGKLCNAVGAETFSSQHYMVAANLNLVGQGWQILTAYVRGNSSGNASYSSVRGANDMGSPATMQANVRFFTPIFYVNYSGKTGATLVDYIKIDVVEVQDQRNLPQIQSGISSITNGGAPLSASDAGSTAKITIAAHSVQYGFGTVAYSSGSVTGLLFSKAYYVYCDDPGYNGGAVTYKVTTSFTVLAAGTHRRFVGKIVTPANGGGGTRPPPDWCVAAGTWLRSDLLVDDCRVGDLIDCWDVGDTDVHPGRIQAVSGEELVPCVRLVLSSGASVVCSRQTPVTGQDGRVYEAQDCLGVELGALHEEEALAWEVVERVEDVGLQAVYKISVGDISYASGEDPCHRVVTHNQVHKP
ncbi:hypothetical protein ACJJJB_00005 (plasmid) [Microbulbifer sp. ANSA001]|uniref:hypothetical protein n=1 Tax=Microbulbifer sp. ANSA001 TaxID=3243358 RepID=UPI0040416502